MEKTTVQISMSTLERLKRLKQHEKESYDFVLNKLIDESDEDELNDEEIEDIKIALEEVKKGKFKFKDMNTGKESYEKF